MLYLFHGTDATRAKKKIRILTDALLKKKPDALHFYFDDRSFENEFLKSLFQSAGLFAEHHIVFLDRVFDLLESKELIKNMQESPHIFIIFEDGLQKKDINFIKKYSEKDEEFNEKKGVEKKDPRKNIFSLTDALVSRDKKRVWVLYQELVGEGVSAEEIQPVLFWQVRSMLAAINSKKPTDAGLKSFVYTKSKGGAEKYGKDGLKKLSRNIVQALYDSRQGSDLENELEKVLLYI